MTHHNIEFARVLRRRTMAEVEAVARGAATVEMREAAADELRRREVVAGQPLPAFVETTPQDGTQLLDYPEAVCAVGGAALLHIWRKDVRPLCGVTSTRDIHIVEVAPIVRRPVCVKCRRFAELTRKD